MFQRTQGTIRMMDVWAPLVGSDHLHVVTVPPRGSDPRLLWRRFAGVLGVDPDAAPRDPLRGNPSVFGHPTTEFLRRINIELGRVARGDVERLVLNRMRSDLVEQARGEPPVVMPRRGLALAARWNRQVRRAIDQHGVHLVGELSDLPIRRPDKSAPKSPSEPTPEQILAIATVARDRLLTLESVLLAAGAEQGGDESSAAPGRSGSGHGTDREEHAVREVAELVRRCAQLSVRVPGETQLETLFEAPVEAPVAAASD